MSSASYKMAAYVVFVYSYIRMNAENVISKKSYVIGLFVFTWQAPR